MAELFDDTSTRFSSRRKRGDEDFDFSSLFSGGLKGVNPFVSGGLELAGGLFSLLGGKDPREKDRSQLFDFLEGFKGRDLINPREAEAFIPRIEQSLVPSLNRLGRRGAKSVGTGSGVFTGELLRKGRAGLEGALLPIMQRILEINAQAPLDISRIQAGLV